MHANCHRADLAFKDALKEAHAFLDVLSDGLQPLAAYYNSSLVSLKGLWQFASERGAPVLKFGRLQDRRWAAFAYGAVRTMGRSYPVVVCALHSKGEPQAQCARSATVWAFGRTRDPYFEILGAPRGIMVTP